MTRPSSDLKFMLQRQLDKMQRDLDALKSLLNELKFAEDEK